MNLKGTDYYGFIRETNFPEVIGECAFLDCEDRFIIKRKSLYSSI
ncbi:MAG: hypothetical protein ACRDD2_14195 [Sarcina sp.]